MTGLSPAGRLSVNKTRPREIYRERLHAFHDMLSFSAAGCYQNTLVISPGRRRRSRRRRRRRWRRRKRSRRRKKRNYYNLSWKHAIKEKKKVSPFVTVSLSTFSAIC